MSTQSVASFRCPSCGAPASPPAAGASPYCPNCGAPLGGAAHPGQYAPHPSQYGPPPGQRPQYPGHGPQYPGHGQPFPVQVQQYPAGSVSPKNRLALFLLCFFIGGLGIHRFYLGKVGTGILMLLTGGGLGIWWLIDCITILATEWRDNEGRRIVW